VTTDTPERRKVIQFVDVMFGEGSSIVGRKGGNVPALNDACGMSLAVSRGSVQESQAQKEAEACKQKGKPALVVQSFASPSEAVLATKSGRADGLVAGTGQSYYLAKSDPALAIGTSGHEHTTVLGFATPLNSPLAPVLREAMLYLHKTGTWEKLIGAYGLESLKPTTELIENESDDVARFLPRTSK
jgi:polar amino acid transport system substrate-binding protein